MRTGSSRGTAETRQYSAFPLPGIPLPQMPHSRALRERCSENLAVIASLPHQSTAYVKTPQETSTMRATLVVICALFLAGCASTIAPSQLEPPAKVLLAASPKLADPKAGDDLVQSHVELRRNYATETGKLARLQRYVRTILQK